MTITLDKDTEAVIAAHPEIAEQVAAFARQQAILVGLRSEKDPVARNVVREILSKPKTKGKSRSELVQEMDSIIDKEIAPHFVDSENVD